MNTRATPSPKSDSYVTGEAYMGLVAKTLCALCARLGHPPLGGTEVHHRRSGTGGGQRATDYDTMGLCYPHHRDHPGAFHVLGTKGFVALYGVTEDQLIADTRRQLGLSHDQVEGWKAQRQERTRKRSARKPIELKALKQPEPVSPLKRKVATAQPVRRTPAAKIPSRPMAASARRITSAGFPKPATPRKIASRPMRRAAA